MSRHSFLVFLLLDFRADLPKNSIELLSWLNGLSNVVFVIFRNLIAFLTVMLSSNIKRYPLSPIFLMLSVSPALASGSRQIGTAWWRSAGRRWTSSGSCAWQSGTPRKQSAPFGFFHSRTPWSGGPYHSWGWWTKKDDDAEQKSKCLWSVFGEQPLLQK